MVVGTVADNRGQRRGAGRRFSGTALSRTTPSTEDTSPGRPERRGRERRRRDARRRRRRRRPWRTATSNTPEIPTRRALREPVSREGKHARATRAAEARMPLATDRGNRRGWQSGETRRVVCHRTRVSSARSTRAERHITASSLRLRERRCAKQPNSCLTRRWMPREGRESPRRRNGGGRLPPRKGRDERLRERIQFPLAFVSAQFPDCVPSRPSDASGPVLCRSRGEREEGAGNAATLRPDPDPATLGRSRPIQSGSG